MKAITTKIEAHSRASVKVGESFYTVEFVEERMIPEGLTNEDIGDEREDLWNTVNEEVDAQIQDILRAFRK